MAGMRSLEAWADMDQQPQASAKEIRAALIAYAEVYEDSTRDLAGLLDMDADTSSTKVVRAAVTKLQDNSGAWTEFRTAASSLDLDDQNDVGTLMGQLYEALDAQQSRAAYKARATAETATKVDTRPYDGLRGFEQVDADFAANQARLGLVDRSHEPSGWKHPSGKRPGVAPATM